MHFHGASDGSVLLGLSLPMDLLTVDDQGTPQTIMDLLHAVDHRCHYFTVRLERCVPELFTVPFLVHFFRQSHLVKFVTVSLNLD